MHTRCRNNFYPRTKETVKRQTVPDDYVSWEIDWQEYKPPSYTSNSVKGKPWADPDLCVSSFRPSWNSIDGNISRISYTGNYKIVDNYPLNPAGRTGLKGRGFLGRWGPNHAADPIVTRWKSTNNGSKVLNSSGEPILQFVAIKRKDNNEWAIPGGMVDPGEKPSQTLQREFMEEALNSLEKDQLDNDLSKEKISAAFSNGSVVYKGYVDDPRNTDNAWIETVATHFHDDDGTSLGSIPLTAGDDAVSVQWVDIGRNLNLYASHATFFKEIVKKLNAHW